MLLRPICLALIACSVPVQSWSQAQQLKRQLSTEKGNTSDALEPHPLAWWTENPLRDDTAGDLMLDSDGADGKPITVADYQLDKKVTTLGTIAGYKIVQIRTVIQPGPRVIAAGLGAGSGDPAGERFADVFPIENDA